MEISYSAFGSNQCSPPFSVSCDLVVYPPHPTLPTPPTQVSFTVQHRDQQPCSMKTFDHSAPKYTYSTQEFNRTAADQNLDIPRIPTARQSQSLPIQDHHSYPSMKRTSFPKTTASDFPGQSDTDSHGSLPLKNHESGFTAIPSTSETLMPQTSTCNDQFSTPPQVIQAHHQVTYGHECGYTA